MEHPTVTDVVTDRLRARLLRGELEPGAELNEVHLARALGVSRTPVREAIRRLADEGLVELLPRRCARVRLLTLKDAAELLDLREALEVMAFRQVAPGITDEDLANLREIQDLYRAACDNSDLEQAVEFDSAFHMYVVRRTGNERLVDFMRKVSISTSYAQLWSYGGSFPLPLGSRDHHQLLLDALATRSADAAEAAIRAHIDNSRRVLVSVWGAGPQTGSAAQGTAAPERAVEPGVLSPRQSAHSGRG